MGLGYLEECGDEIDSGAGGNNNLGSGEPDGQLTAAISEAAQSVLNLPNHPQMISDLLSAHLKPDGSINLVGSFSLADAHFTETTIGGWHYLGELIRNCAQEKGNDVGTKDGSLMNVVDANGGSMEIRLTSDGSFQVVGEEGGYYENSNDNETTYDDLSKALLFIANTMTVNSGGLRLFIYKFVVQALMKTD